MEDDHIMTADEIDALFRDDIEEVDKATPGINVTFIKAERKQVAADRKGCVIMCTIWNDSDKKVSLRVRSYVINDKKEQHRAGASCRGYDVSGTVTIRPGAHVIKGDIFYEEYTGTLSAGWIYGVEIEDEHNRDYDTEFELMPDGIWHKSTDYPKL